MTKKNYPQDFFKYAVELYNAHVEHVYHHCSNDWRLVSPDGCHYILSRFRIWHRLWSWHRYGTGTRSGKNKSYGCCVSVSRHQIAYILRFLRVHWTKLGREFSVSSAGQQYVAHGKICLIWHIFWKIEVLMWKPGSTVGRISLSNTHMMAKIMAAW